MKERFLKRVVLTGLVSLFTFCVALTATLTFWNSARAADNSVWGSEKGVIRESSDVAVTYNYDILHSRFAPFAYIDGKTDMAGVHKVFKYFNGFLAQQSQIYSNPVLLETKRSGSAAEGAAISLGKYTGLFNIVLNPVLTSYVTSLSETAAFPISNIDEKGSYPDPQIVTVKDRFNGKNGLTMDGRDSNLNEYIDFTSFSIVFNDLQNKGTYFKLTFSQGKGNNSSIFAAFKTAEMVKEQIGEMKNWNNFSGSFVSSGGHQPFGFVFNPIARTLEMGTSRIAKYNLFDDSVGVTVPSNPNNGKSPNLTSFTEGAMSSDFEVEIQFNGFDDTQVKDFWREGIAGQPTAYERKGRLAVYSINSQELLGDPSALPERASAIYKEQYVWADVRDGFDGNDYSIPKLKRYSQLYGEIDVVKINGIEITEKESGAKVERKGYTIPKANLAAGKNYVIKYDFKNLKDDLRNVNFEFRYLIDAEKPIIEFASEYRAYYPIGTEVEILQPTITDNSGSVAGSSVTIKYGAEAINPIQGKIVLNRAGEYTVTYVATDAKGNETVKVYAFNAYEVVLPSLTQSEITASPFKLPQATVGDGLNVSINVYKKGEPKALATDVTEFTFTEVGEYVFEYVVKDGKGVIIDVREIGFTFTDITAPEIEIDGVIENYYEEGTILKVPAFTAKDNATYLLDKRVMVTYGSDEIEVVDNAVELNKTGNYSISYYAIDYSDNETTETFVFKVYRLDMPDYVTYVANGKDAVLPVATVSEPLTLKAQLFASSDTEFSDVLTEKNTYVFEKSGDYVMRYSVMDGDVVVLSKTFAFTVEETAAPVLDLPEYEKTYTVGAKVTILQATASNNSDREIDIAYKVYFGQTDITDSVINGILTLNESGVYKIVYTATAFDGKTDKKLIEFSALPEDEKESGGCASSVMNSDTGTFALVGFAVAAVAAVFVRKRKGE